MAAITNANVVADYFINLAQRSGDLITPLKLQKLVYYADAWHIVHYDNELIEENFEAWVHGPVVRSLYKRFEKYQWNPITEEVKLPSELALSTSKYLHELFSYFNKYTAYELEQMTHLEEPWLEARRGVPIDEACTNKINKATMKSFYKNLLTCE